jgi:tRNA nucleotidyltransferase/poly(A) polymerase
VVFLGAFTLLPTTFLMLRVNAFATPRCSARATSRSRLAAINSRELRFYKGGHVHPKQSSSAADIQHHQPPSSSSFSLPEVLVASMSNYFFGQATNNLLNFATYPQGSQAMSMSSTQVQSRTAKWSTTAVLDAYQPKVMVARESYHTSRGPGKHDDEDDLTPAERNSLRNRIEQQRNAGGGPSDQDDNTSPLLESTNTLYRQPKGAFPNVAPPSTHTTSQYPPPRQGYGYSIQLTDEEKALFHLLRKVHQETHLTTTLRVAGGWVRDKLLATPEFQIFHRYSNAGKRLTSKFKSSPTERLRLKNMEQPSMGRQGTKVLGNDGQQQGPVDIDIALDTMVGREFADLLNEYLQEQGEDTVSVGVVLKNPEKSKHLETATMKVGSFWIDFVNLRAEEYAEDSRIPDLMRIGTAEEDAFRRDLTINSLFYNINTGQVEDWTGRGFADLRRGVVATPLAPLTTLLDDPLRVLRSIRFAARLRFTMHDELVAAAKNDRVRMALAQKVSRERVGGEVDLMLRSPDPVGAMRLLINLNLVDTVFPVASCWPTSPTLSSLPTGRDALAPLFDQCIGLLSTTHDHLFDCKITPPVWCQSKQLLTTNNVQEATLSSDEEARRLLWYAAFLKPVYDYEKRLKRQVQDVQPGSNRAGRKANRSIMSKLLVDELKRPIRDAEAVEKIMKSADEITHLIESGSDVSATLILLSEVRVRDKGLGLIPTMRGRLIDPASEDDPVWQHAMEFRLLCSRVLLKVGGLWRAALMLSLSEQLASLNEGELEYIIEGDMVCTFNSQPAIAGSMMFLQAV